LYVLDAAKDEALSRLVLINYKAKDLKNDKVAKDVFPNSLLNCCDNL